MPLDPVETLQQLIQTPSVNPMGRDVSGPTYGESRMTDLLVDICERAWLAVVAAARCIRAATICSCCIEGNPSPRERRRVAAVGRAPGHRAGRRHDGRSVWRRSARWPRVWPRRVRRERLDGGDAGGAVACCRRRRLTSDPSLRERNRRPTIVLAFTANEECGFTGARVLAICGTRSTERS